MVKDQLKQEFKYLSEGEMVQGCYTVKDRLLKVRKDMTAQEAEEFIGKTLTKLSDPVFRKRFRSILHGINPNNPLGLKTGSAFIDDMILRNSVYNFFVRLEGDKQYEASGLKAAIHGARRIFQSMPANSVTKFQL